VEIKCSHLKTEKIYLLRPNTPENMRQAVEEYILFYNNDRFQKKLSDRSPVEYRIAAAA
jgi:putative transposase